MGAVAGESVVTLAGEVVMLVLGGWAGFQVGDNGGSARRMVIRVEILDGGEDGDHLGVGFWSRGRRGCPLPLNPPSTNRTPLRCLGLVADSSECALIWI